MAKVAMRASIFDSYKQKKLKFNLLSFFEHDNILEFLPSSTDARWKSADGLRVQLLKK